LKKSGGFLYKGKFKNNKPDGLGEEHYPDHTSYVGNYKDGKKNGIGYIKWIITK